MGLRNEALVWRLLLLMFAVVGLGWCVPARAVTLVEQAQLTLALHGQAPAQVQTPQTVALPYDWDQRQGAVDGEARFAFEIPAADPATPLALFVPRLGNSFRLSVNGQELARFGAFPPAPYDDASFAPQYFMLPASGSASPQRVEIVIAAQAARQGGLSPVVVGSEAEILPLYERALFWHVSGGRFIAIASGVLGALSLLVWLRQREPIYLYCCGRCRRLACCSRMHRCPGPGGACCRWRPSRPRCPCCAGSPWPWWDASTPGWHASWA